VRLRLALSYGITVAVRVFESVDRRRRLWRNLGNTVGARARPSLTGLHGTETGPPTRRRGGGDRARLVVSPTCAR